MSLRIVVGEETTKVSKTAAEQALLAHPEFPNDADYTLSEANGRWVAAFVEAKKDEESEDSTEEKDEVKKEATDEASEPNEEPDEEKTAAGPAPGDIPIDAGAPMDEPAPSEDSEEPKDETSGLKAELDHLTKAVNKIVDALGLTDGPPKGSEDSPVDLGDSPGPHAPSGGGSTLTNGKGQEIPKQKAIPQGALLKPGVSPPAFASVSDDHPWKEQIESRVLSFEVEEEIEADAKIASIMEELTPLIERTGYRIGSIIDRVENDIRLASVTIVAEEDSDHESDNE